MGDKKSQPTAQAGQTSKAGGVAGEVGVPHSSVDLHYFKRCREPRGDTYSTHRSEAKDEGMAGATRIVTPKKVRELQIVLYRKAEAQPKYRFWTLCAAGYGGVEGSPMNEFGEPNMGNPSVRFDEGRESVGHWPLSLSAHPLPPTLHNETRTDWALVCTKKLVVLLCVEANLASGWKRRGPEERLEFAPDDL
jgi:hypothetical protein